jgi:DNA-binding CsgD family transcriptional regulator/PAS domain-containing protein
MIIDKRYSDLLGKIYECAINDRLWSSALEEINQISGSLFIHIAAYNLADMRMKFQHYFNYPNELFAIAGKHIHENPALPLGLVIPIGEPYCLSREVGLEAVAASPYWQKVYKPFGSLDGASTPLTRNVVVGSSLDVARAIEKGPYEDEELDFLRLIAPHLRRAVEISEMLSDYKTVRGTMAEVLESIAAAAIVFSPDGAIRFMNQAAEQAASHGGLIRIRNGALTPIAPKVRDLIAEVRDMNQQTARDITLDPGQPSAVQITCARLSRVEQDLNAPLLLLIRKPEAELQTPIATMSKAFGLTTAETLTLAQILQGMTLEQAAELRGVARSTVKTHLDAIYAKSGVSKQTDLMKVVAGFISPLGPPSAG